MTLNKANKAILLERIQSRFGGKITSNSMCDDLSNHISKCINVNISGQTLRRLFGFINDGSVTSASTVSFLVKYCGFSSLEELIKYSESIKNAEPDSQKVKIIKEFYNIKLSQEFDFNYQNACGNIAKELLQDNTLLFSLDGFLSKSPIAQVFFFERHPYIDGLSTEYSHLLKLYAQEKQNPEAQLFAYCLLHFGTVLSQNKEAATCYIEKINKIDCNPTIHPFVQARKIMSHLIHAWFLGEENELEQWIETAFDVEKKQERVNIRKAYFPFFQFIIADAFNFIGKHEEALEMVKIAEKDYKKLQNSPIEQGYYECLSLIKAIALFHTGNKKQSKEVLKQINNEDVIFSSKKYFLLQRYTLELHMTAQQSVAKRQKISQNINELVKQTGFVHYSV